MEGFEAGLPQRAYPTVVLGSHDEPRLATRVGERQARTAAMLLLTLRGAPFIYYGDEIGMTDVPIPEHRLRDPWPKTAGLPASLPRPGPHPYAVGGRPGAGFSPAAANSERPEPWLPINPDHRQRNVQAQLANSRSMLSLYRRLLQLRRTSPALHAGSYRSAAGAPEGTYVYYRTQGQQEVLVALNFTGAEVMLQLEDARGGCCCPPSWTGRSQSGSAVAHSGRMRGL